MWELAVMKVPFVASFYNWKVGLSAAGFPHHWYIIIIIEGVEVFKCAGL